MSSAVTVPGLSLDPESYPDSSLLITHDGAPLDNIYAERQQRLLTAPLHASLDTLNGKPFRAYANVGLFNRYKDPPMVPDVMLCLNVPPMEGTPNDPDNRSFFTWVMGKLPEVVIELVSDPRGREDSDKMAAYYAMPILHYVIHDPLGVLERGELRYYLWTPSGYELRDPKLLPGIGLGLTLWDGDCEGVDGTWVRWTDTEGRVIPTGEEQRERAEAEAKRAETFEKRAETLERRALTADERIRILEERLRGAGLSANGDS